MADMVAKVKAAEATVARFSGQPFEWGKNDCLRMAAFALRELGHAPPLRQAGQYRTLLGAHKALARTGHATLRDWIDAWGLQSIPHAFAMAGDLLALPSNIARMPALGLQLSGGRFLCFVQDTGAAEVTSFAGSDQPLAAWRT